MARGRGRPTAAGDDGEGGTIRLPDKNRNSGWRSRKKGKQRVEEVAGGIGCGRREGADTTSSCTLATDRPTYFFFLGGGTEKEGERGILLRAISRSTRFPLPSPSYPGPPPFPSVPVQDTLQNHV